MTAVAARLGAPPAQAILAWQWGLGIPTHPRSMNPQHLADNLAAYSFTLNQTEMHLMSTRPQDLCGLDASWYECACVVATAGPPLAPPPPPTTTTTYTPPPPVPFPLANPTGAGGSGPK